MKFLIPLLLLPVLAVAQSRYGHEPYGPPSPLDVCVSPITGHIAVADTEKNQVALLDADWKPQLILGADSGVERPVGLARTPSDDLAVLMGGGKPRVVVYSANGRLIREFTCPADKSVFKEPRGLVVDESGNYFVFDSGNHRVVVFDRNGGYIFDFNEYIWTRDHEGVREVVHDRLETPVRGDFLPDGRLIIVDYDGPVVNPKTGQRGGRYSVWRVDTRKKEAQFIQWAYPSVPYETSKAGDVIVDRRTGEIFYAEADFPLTDFGVIKHSEGIGEDPDFERNLLSTTALTYPVAVALGINGDVIIADADKGYAFSVPRSYFNKSISEDWPRRQRLISATENSVTIQYDSLEPVPTVVKVAPAPEEGYIKHSWFPQNAELKTGEAYNADGVLLKDNNARGERHRITLTGLQPGKRYAYRFFITDKAYPSPVYSETRLATTDPPKGKTEYISSNVTVLLFTNVYEPAEGVPAPGPMTAEEISALKQRMEAGRMFYWVNSRCKLDLRLNWVMVDTEYLKIPFAHYGYWPEDEHQQVDQILSEHGADHDSTGSLFCIYGLRYWDARNKKWTLALSGGNTWGSCHDGSAITVINAGGDTAWLLIHEHGHGIGIDYGWSGQVWHFNHFHWNQFPERYGSSYDGNVAIARAFKDLEYLSNLYGRLEIVDDVDGDGIPDNDPSCALDEKRFNSDPGKLDTDNDGLNDLQELMASDGMGDYPCFDVPIIQPYYAPNPRDKDTDRDGIIDGQDRYPLYPFEPAIYKLPVILDGKVSSSEYSKGFKRVMDDPDLKGTVQMAYTDDYLIFGIRQKAQDYKMPVSLYIEIDGTNDGQSVGADNQEIRLKPLDGGKFEVTTYYNDTIARAKPVWRNNDYPMAQDCFAKWTKVGDEYHIELAVPKTPEAGIYLEKWRQMGILVELAPQGKQNRRLIQAQQRIDMELK